MRIATVKPSETVSVPNSVKMAVGRTLVGRMVAATRLPNTTVVGETTTDMTTGRIVTGRTVGRTRRAMTA